MLGHGGARGEPRKKATSPSSWPQMTILSVNYCHGYWSCNYHFNCFPPAALSTVGSEDDDSLEDGKGLEEKEEEDSFEKEDSDADSSAVRKNQDISDIFNQVEQIASLFPHRLSTFRPLSGVKLRLEKGGGGNGARGRARKRALSGAQTAGPEGRKKLWPRPGPPPGAVQEEATGR